MIDPVILVVEDNQTEQYVLKLLLESFDYSANIVSSGEEALAAFGLARYAGVLMDITLPGINGYKCTKLIRLMERGAGTTRTPIIALTARAQPHDHNACLEADMDDYMSKPFDPEELRKMLIRHIYVPNKPNLKVMFPYQGKHPYGERGAR